MSKAQEFLKKESLSPELRSEAIIIHGQLTRFLGRYRTKLNDEEIEILTAAVNALDALKMDE